MQVRSSAISIPVMQANEGVRSDLSDDRLTAAVRMSPRGVRTLILWLLVEFAKNLVHAAARAGHDELRLRNHGTCATVPFNRLTA